MELFLFLFLILNGFYKGFQLRYHLFLNSNGNMLKKVKMSEWESACTKIYVRQCMLFSTPQFLFSLIICYLSQFICNLSHFIAYLTTPYAIYHHSYLNEPPLFIFRFSWTDPVKHHISIIILHMFMNIKQKSRAVVRVLTGRGPN